MPAIFFSFLTFGLMASAQLIDSSGNPVTEGSGNPVLTGAQDTAALPVVRGVSANTVDGTKYCFCNTVGAPLVSQNNRESWESYLAESGAAGSQGAGGAARVTHKKT